VSEPADGVSATGGGTDAATDAGVDPDASDHASDAFKLLSNGTRIDVLRALFETDESGRVTPTERTFSELYEATEEGTTAGFAYHLRQLVGQFLVKDEERETYRLTYAGLQVARGVAAGLYTESVDREPVPLSDPCPFCAATDLELRVADNLTTVACAGCGGDVLSLPFPPGGFRSHDGASLPRAFDRHHRHRIALMTDGNCPECGGAVRGRIEVVGEDGDDGEDKGNWEPEPIGADDPLLERATRASLDCETCGYGLRCPVTLTLLDNPAVVAFYYDHGVDLDGRPLWNVGEEWAERVISDDPLAVRVSTWLDDELLSVFVGRDLSVVHEERSEVADGELTEEETASEAETNEREEPKGESERERDPEGATA
jgi:DNA-binding transcriptional ArsR family regulator